MPSIIIYLATHRLCCLVLFVCIAGSFNANAKIGEFYFENIDEPRSISGQWHFKTGDNLNWASQDLDKTDWTPIEVPLTWVDQGYADHTGMAWYRVHLQFDIKKEKAWDDLSRLAITLGKVHSAYEIYANGQLLGGVGVLPPNPTFNYDEQKIYQIPQSSISDTGELVLALRVWGGGTKNVTWEGGTYDGPFLVGIYSDLIFTKFYSLAPALVLAMIYLFVGLYHLYLYQKNRQIKAYLWYGIMAIDISIYTFFVSQWSHAFGMPFLIQKKIEFSVLYLQPALWIQMIPALLEYKIKPWLRAYQLTFILWVLPIILIPDLNVHFATLSYWQLWTMPVVIVMPLFVWWRAYKKNREARLLWMGLMIFAITCVNDILIDFAHAPTPHLIPYGFFAIIIFMMISLANKLTSMFSNLESEVKTRTQELNTANAQLLYAAKTDQLTGILNRRGFSESAQKEINRSTRTQRPLSLVMADIDHFKNFNDQYGHACGDHVLREVSLIMERQMRDVDIFARWGGEEFIVLLPETELNGGVILADKLRLAIANNQFDYEGTKIRVTMTFGIAQYQQDQTLDECLQLADAALYRGKNSGRNCVNAEPMPDASLNDH